jgi:hypothetical protein
MKRLIPFSVVIVVFLVAGADKAGPKQSAAPAKPDGARQPAAAGGTVFCMVY